MGGPAGGRRRRGGLIALGALGLAAALAYADWRPNREDPPVVVVQARAEGGLYAGAARVDLAPPFEARVSGYPLESTPSAGLATPLLARAVVLEAGGRSVGLALAEVLELPAAVADEVRRAGRALGLDEVIVLASHAHSSFGGYDSRWIAQLAGIGRHDERAERHLVERMVEALRSARQRREPARVTEVASRLDGFNRNRAGSLEVDSRLSVLAVDGMGGVPIARLVVFAAHPTLVPRRSARLDGDWPGRAMAALEGDGGVALVLQGAVGDASASPPPGEPRQQAMADRVAEGVRALLARPELAAAPPAATPLGFATARVALPAAEPGPGMVPDALRRPAANLLELASPRAAELTVLRAGGACWLFVPAEPTAAAAAALERACGERGVLVSFAQGYVGYVELPERVRGGTGEAKRTLFGPELLGRFEAGAKLAASASE